MTEQLEQKQIQCTEMESYGSIRHTYTRGNPVRRYADQPSALLRWTQPVLWLEHVQYYAGDMIYFHAIGRTCVLFGLWAYDSSHVPETLLRHQS